MIGQDILKLWTSIFAAYTSRWVVEWSLSLGESNLLAYAIACSKPSSYRVERAAPIAWPDASMENDTTQIDQTLLCHQPIQDCLQKLFACGRCVGRVRGRRVGKIFLTNCRNGLLLFAQNCSKDLTLRIITSPGVLLAVIRVVSELNYW